MTSNNPKTPGVLLPNGCRITHGPGATIKHPFLTSLPSLTLPFSDQLGFVPFTTALRLPRHIHMDGARRRLLDERILFLDGVGLVQLAGELFVVAPGSLVEAAGGAPHAWTVCPAGAELADWIVSEGEFTMVDEYEDVTGFFPTVAKGVLRGPAGVCGF